MIASATPDAPDTHGMPVAHVLARHFDPVRGSLFWLRRAAELGIDRPHATLRGLGDLPRLGILWPHEMRKVPLMDLVPRSLHQSRSNLLVAQTGGTTGPGVWTAWLPEEFTDAFVRPFALAASAAGFPRGGTWLALCPSGPHIIGRAAIAIARATGGMDPFMIDLDPRWIRSLEPGSFVHGRYVAHVLAQAADVLEHQPIDVLFATPPLLLALAERLPESVHRRIRGVPLPCAENVVDQRVLRLRGTPKRCAQRAVEPARGVHLGAARRRTALSAGDHDRGSPPTAGGVLPRGRASLGLRQHASGLLSGTAGRRPARSLPTRAPPAP